MNKIKYMLLVLAALVGLASCSDNELAASYDPSELGELEMVSITPAAGSTAAPGSEVTVTAEFNQPVLIADTTAITVSGGTISKLYTVACYLKATVKTEQGASVNFNVAPGALRTIKDVKSTAQYATNFTMNRQKSNKTIEAERLLEWMQSIYGKKIISGVTAAVDWNIHEAEWVYYHTGKWPAMNTFDFIHDGDSGPNSWINYGDPTPALKWAEAGGIVSAMWHCGMLAADGVNYSCTPWTEESNDPTYTKFRPSCVYNPESADYKELISRIDRIAGFMKPIAEAGIPIIWRPWHEGQGNWTEEHPGDSWHHAWFWWGIDGPEAYVALWRVTYDRMVNYHGLNNLIWMYNVGNSMRWYPGDEYVDLIAFDTYNQDAATMIAGRNEYVEYYPTKMLGMAECGGIPNIGEWWDGGAKYLFFSTWYHNQITGDPSSEEFKREDHNNFTASQWRDAWSKDYVISRDDVPSFK